MTEVSKAIQFRRVDALPPYAFAEVERLKLELRRSGEDVIDFGYHIERVPLRRHADVDVQVT